ncbi:serine/arginine repetitive matrix protein 1-like [Panthera tigris]|uniref:serine/arginine repetitive matrix protein 1-like n=1 Tax=Panthera tigris TaxID=9694 RepID=UPI001C6FBEF5|nr:serine/arginine repetitive matrix protein 1-like [Panthera tigris]
MAPTKTRTPPTEGAREQYARTRLQPPPPPGHPGTVVGVTPSQERGTGEGAGLPAAPSRPAPSAREDQSPRSWARRMLPPRSPERAPPSEHPRRAPPDTLRRRAGAVISALLGPRGTRNSLKGRSRSALDISLPPEYREPEPRARTYRRAGRLAPRHDAVGTGGLRGENEERCKLVPEKESKWRFWMCKVHQLRSHFPSSSSPTGREVGEELATPAPQPSSRPPPRPPAQLLRPHARRLALPLSP